MRIWFGLILKIMMRTKSYILPKMRYFTKHPELQTKLPFFLGPDPFDPPFIILCRVDVV